MAKGIFRSMPLLAALALLSCGEVATESMTLVDYDFRQAQEDSLYGQVWGRDRGLHSFVSGWSMAREKNFWTRGSHAEMQLHLEGRRARMHLVVSSLPALIREGQSFTVQLNDRELLTHAIDHPGLDTLDVELPDDLWQPGLNTFVIEPQRWYPPPKDFGVALHELRVTAHLTAGERSRWSELAAAPPRAPDDESVLVPAGAVQVATGPEQPDLLVFLIDTLRADHLSAYGYARPTSPAFDELAREGIVLENVIAEAPYTLSSVPSFFTAHSWRDHRVLVEGDALSEDFVTLAEVLQGAGYTTIGISDNLHVSKLTHLDQGFDEMYETYTDEEHEALGLTGFAPEAPELRFVERLGRGLPADPVFLYVHTLTPHAPYFPGDDHDLWKPANYEGPIDGSTQQVHEFDRGERAASGPDYERLLSCYDGSIHRGDASLARMLRAWRALDRERPALVVVVSDHGEGFGEHGRFAHSTTPYDEMLHVPVVLYPASLAHDLRGSTSALRTLSDVMPLILHTLDVSFPPQTSWPQRALTVFQDPASPRSGVFVRCHRPVYALRTAKTLTVLEGWNRQEFYDLTADPTAQVNLRWKQPDRYLDQLVQLRAFVENQGVEISPASANLSPEDIERLKALGYM